MAIDGRPARSLNRFAIAIAVTALVVGAGIVGSALLGGSSAAVTATPTGTSTTATAFSLASNSSGTETAEATTAANGSGSTSPPCGEAVYDSRTSLTMENVPVLLMQPGTVATICVTYQSEWQGNSSQYRSQFFENDTYQFSLSIGDEHCATSGSGGGSCSGAVSHSFVVSASPGSIQPSSTTDYVSVVYTVRALANSTGFYDRSAPYDYCIGMPMAVGYSASQVNSSDFDPIVQPPCALLPFGPVGVSVGGMGVVYVPFGSQTETESS